MTDTARDLLAEAIDTGTSGQAPDWYADAIWAALDTAGVRLLSDATPEGQRISEAVALLDAVERLIAAPVYGAETAVLSYDHQDDRWGVTVNGFGEFADGEAEGPLPTPAILAAIGDES